MEEKELRNSFLDTFCKARFLYYPPRQMSSIYFYITVSFDK